MLRSRISAEIFKNNSEPCDFSRSVCKTKMEKKMKVEDSPSLPPACPRGSFYTRCSLLLYVVARSLLHSAPARHFLPVPVVARNIPPTSTKTAFSSSLLIRGPCSYVSHRRHAELYLRRSLHCTTTSTTRRAKPLAHSCS